MTIHPKISSTKSFDLPIHVPGCVYESVKNSLCLSREIQYAHERLLLPQHIDLLIDPIFRFSCKLNVEAEDQTC